MLKWFMWEGMPSCDKLSPGSYFALSLLILGIILSFIGLLFALLAVNMVYQSKRTIKNSFGGTLLMNILACGFAIIYLCGTVYSLTTPLGQIIRRGSQFPDKYQAGYYIEYSMVSPLFFFTTASFLNVSVVWNNIAQSTAIASISKFHRLQKWWNKIILFCEIIMGIGVIVILIVGFIGFILLWILPFLIFIVIMTILGSWRMYHVLKGHNSSSFEPKENHGNTSGAATNISKRSSLKSSLRLIMRTGIVMTFWSSAIVLITVVYSIFAFQVWKNLTPLGQLNPLEFYSCGYCVAAAGMDMTVAIYLYLSTRLKTITKEANKPSNNAVVNPGALPEIPNLDSYIPQISPPNSSKIGAT
jgi:hypothetical protein